jgi:hypothetical protein
MKIADVCNAFAAQSIMSTIHIQIDFNYFGPFRTVCAFADGPTRAETE